MNKIINSKFVKSILSSGLHAIFVAVVVYFVWPILILYWNQKPAVGIDLFLSVDFVTYIHSHLGWPWSWKYIWYGGTPLTQTYPLLHFYLIQPLLHFFSAVQAVQVYVLATYVIFFIFSYLLFYSLSKSRALSSLLAVGCAYSFNLWSQLYWAGSIPYTATLFLLPLSLFLIHRGYESRNKKFIYLSALLNGLFLLGHPQSFIGYTVPLASILILFFWDEKTKILQWKKFFTLFVYGIIIFFAGFPIDGTGVVVLEGFSKIFNSLFAGPSKIAQGPSVNFAASTSGTLDPVQRMVDIYTRSNHIFFWALGVSLVISAITLLLVLPLKRRISQDIKLLLPFSLMLLYLLIFIFSFAKGLNPIAGGWYRVFWPTMIILGSLVAILWRIATNNIEIIFENISGKSSIFRVFLMVLAGFVGLIVLASGIKFLQTTYSSFQKETLSFVSESSAFPTALSLNLKKGEWPEKLPKLVPDWLNPNALNYRLYDMDATINIWWNSVFKMPLARGYLDASPGGPNGENYSGWQYIQNVVFSKDEAVKRFGYSVDQAKAMAAFFIDWHAIKYWEGVPVYGRDYASAPSGYILDDKNFITRSESVFTLRPARFFQIEARGWNIPDTQQELRYYEINSQITSPIYSASNAPTILVIGDAIGQDTIMRDLGLLNFNSRRAIIIQWNRPIDSISQKELNKFDVVVAYRYKYNNYANAFRNLENYVKDGGNLFIDTGTEQKESVNQHLLSVFPFEQSNRRDLGKDWDLKIENDQITNGIIFDKFSEPVFDDVGWSFSYPETNLKDGAKTLISNHQKSVLVSYGLGKGKIIWSGMNLAGHIQRFKNPEEVSLLKNILFYFADFSKDLNMNAVVNRPSSGKVIIKGNNAKAVLFKESAYSGWQAKASGNGFDENLTLYEAGPMVPGYMYAFLPEKAKNEAFEVTFEYKGEMFDKLTYLISMITVLVVLDILFFKKVGTKLVGRCLKHGHKKVTSWWEKDEEN